MKHKIKLAEQRRVIVQKTTDRKLMKGRGQPKGTRVAPPRIALYAPTEEQR